MAELGSGNGTGYPSALDTDSSIEYDDGEAVPTTQRADVPNDLAAAVVAIETELGVTPKRTSTSVATRIGDVSRYRADGRLTLTTATPITTADVTAAGTLYYAPFRGNTVYLYESSIWEPHALTEKTLDISGYTASKPYDIFIYDNSGTLTLSGTAWTNTTTRATALTTQDGIYVKNGATSYRYLGTICMTAVAGQCEDSLDFRGVWNYYNRVPRMFRVIDSTNSWEYQTATWRQANSAAGNKVEMVIGVSENPVEIEVYCAKVANSGGGVDVAVGVGIDAVDTNSAQSNGGWTPACPSAKYRGYPGIGYHYAAWIEISATSGTTTWVGDNNVAYIQSGLTGAILG